MSHFSRITQDPAVMGGKPCIRGQRVTVGMIVGEIGAGRSIEELLADYPILNVRTCLRLCATRPGAPRNGKSICSARRDALPDRHESVAETGSFFSRWRDIKPRTGLRSGPRMPSTKMARVQPEQWSKYPPAKPKALGYEPLKAAFDC